jgi:DNA replication protein DnaC
MYTDHITPAIDTTRDRLGELLAARGITPEQVNHDDGDPQSRSSLIRRAVCDSRERIPRHYRDAVPTSPEVRAWVDELVAGAGGRIVPAIGTGPSLLLLGPTGVGKTYEAFGAIRDLMVTGVKAKWTAATAADIYAALRPRHLVDSEAEFKRFADSPLLVVDDLGAAKATEWTEEVNYRLINHRYEAEKPTLITSNVRPSQLGDALGDRVASRLTEMCQRVVLKGSDRRRAA